MREGEPLNSWASCRLKNLFVSVRNGLWGSGPGEDQVDVVCVRVADFNRQTGYAGPDVSTIRSITKSQLKTHGLQPGDILLEKSGGGDLQPVGFAVLHTGKPAPAVCSNFVARGVVQSSAVPRFVNYLLRSLYDRRMNKRFIKQSTGIQNLDSGGFLSLKVDVPTRARQSAIADFLDRETVHIDRLIEKKERLIALLEEKRSALITRAVTKGLDPDVPMKDSGVEWIGEIPEHWRALQIRRVCKIESGHTPARSVPEYWRGGTIPWVSLADTARLRQADVISETEHRITHAGLANSSARMLPKGTVLFTRDATVGLAAVAGQNLAVSQHLIAWVCGPFVSPFYLLCVVRSMTQELERLTEGATLRTIGMDDVRSLAMPLPPVDEQPMIASHARAKSKDLDEVLAGTRRSLSLLSERRSALITAAVTGQIDLDEYEASHRSALGLGDEDLHIGELSTSALAADP